VKIAPYFAKQIESSFAELSKGMIAHHSLDVFSARLQQIWEPPPVAAPRIEESVDVWHALEFMPEPLPVSPAPPARRPPPWYIGMTSGFSRAITGIDRKLQGRILEALADLIKNPLEMRGDTIKPLGGGLKGCWRYRIGNFRMIYSADRKSGDVTLLAFTARSSAYDE
jgi:mRNA-degrading endonuclease RelE of RelBE toxin-antitoxin system